MSIITVIGKELKNLRVEKGLSQEQLALSVGLDRTYISSVELGKRNVTIASLEKILKGLDLTVLDFFEYVKDHMDIEEL